VGQKNLVRKAQSHACGHQRPTSCTSQASGAFSYISSPRMRHGRRVIRPPCSSVRQPLSGVPPPAWHSTAYAAGRRFLGLLGSCAVSLLCALCIRRDAKLSGCALWGTRLHSRWRSRISIACSVSFASSTALSTNDFCSRISLEMEIWEPARRARYNRTVDRGQKRGRRRENGLRQSRRSRRGAEPRSDVPGTQEGSQRRSWWRRILPR
jgi:hypothetical protein